MPTTTTTTKGFVRIPPQFILFQKIARWLGHKNTHFDAKKIATRSGNRSHLGCLVECLLAKHVRTCDIWSKRPEYRHHSPFTGYVNWRHLDIKKNTVVLRCRTVIGNALIDMIPWTRRRFMSLTKVFNLLSRIRTSYIDVSLSHECLSFLIGIEWVSYRSVVVVAVIGVVVIPYTVDLTSITHVIVRLTTNQTGSSI